MHSGIFKTLREHRKAWDVLRQLSGGKPCEINRPVYVSIGVREYRLTTRKIEAALSAFEESNLIDEKDGKIIIKENATKYLQ